MVDAAGPTRLIAVGMGTLAVTLAAVSVLASHGYPVMLLAFLAVGVGVALVDGVFRLTLAPAFGQQRGAHLAYRTLIDEP